MYKIAEVLQYMFTYQNKSESEIGTWLKIHKKNNSKLTFINHITWSKSLHIKSIKEKSGYLQQLYRLIVFLDKTSNYGYMEIFKSIKIF